MRGIRQAMTSGQRARYGALLTSPAGGPNAHRAQHSGRHPPGDTDEIRDLVAATLPDVDAEPSFTHAAALGELVAQTVAGEQPFTDASFLDPRRLTSAA
jgi:hypothetical protein